MGLKLYAGIGAAGAAVLMSNPAPEALAATEPGHGSERVIVAGESHAYALASSGGAARRLVLEQHGIDVVAVVVAGDGTRLAELNDPLGRFDREVFWLDPRGERLEIRPLEGGVASGSYEMSVETAVREAPGEDPGYRAELRMTEAAGLRYGGSEAEMRRAAELYEAAAAEFAAAGDRQGTARARLSAANFRRRLGEAGPAFELYEESRELWSRIGDRGFVADSLVGLGQCARRLGRPEEARALLEEALATWEELGRGPERAATLTSLGLLAHIRGDFPAAVSQYLEALDEQLRAGARLEVANLLLNIGGVRQQLGDAEAALGDERESLEIFRDLGDREGELDALNNLAGLHRQMGEPEEALRLYGEALGLARELGDFAGEARALNNRGFAYRILGEPDRAGEDLERALALRREAGDQRGELIGLTNLGDVETDRGNLETARGHLEAALELAHRRQDYKEIGLLGRLGRLLARLGDTAAKGRFEQAHELLSRRSNPVDEAELFYRQSEALLDLGEPGEARRCAQRALALWDRLDDGAGQVLALTALGRAERSRGRPAEARRALEDAVERLESLRAELANPDLRATFLAARHDVYALLVDVLMDLHATDPGGGHQRAALEISERARARRLLDLLAEAEIELEQAVAPELASRRRNLVRRLSLLVRRRQLVALGRRSLSPGEDLDALIADVNAELDVVEGEIRRRDPRRAVLAPSAMLSAEDVRELVGPDTTVLYYALGEERSHLWTVSSSGIVSFSLAPRRDIERTARRLHENLATLDPSARDARRSALAALAEMVLEPAAAELSGERLAIVADGALHYVPFAALPLAGGGSDLRVLDRYETVRLPSAAFLAARRHEAETGPARESAVAILADPVFDPFDPRLAGRPTPEPAGPEAETDRLREPGTVGFGRLPGSRLEADAVAEWIPPERRFVALGFEASRDALSGLAGYAIVHFATHGVVDTEHPELSGLVLAQYEAGGRRRADGFLRLHDVYALDLDADLVVLSGCRTGLGREIRGEGFVGLTGGFFYAGARRVLSSLWPVADRATAELVRHFYRGLLAEGLSSAAALRRAQLAVAGDRRFRDPYYWAAFVLQGDWR